MTGSEVVNDRYEPDSSFVLIDTVLDLAAMLTVQLIACELSGSKPDDLVKPETLVRLRESALQFAGSIEEISRAISQRSPASGIQ